MFKAPKGRALIAYRQAKQLAADGWAVIPLHHPAGYRGCSCQLGPECKSIGKHPVTKNGLKDASNDPRVVDTWHNRYPQANWAIVLPEQVVVIDVDPKHGGHRSWSRLLDQHGNHPPVTAVWSGQTEPGVRGAHLYYRSPGGVKNNSNPATGIDRRSAGGYVVAPGSWHPSGVAYEGVVPPLRDVSGWPEVPAWALVASEPSDASTSPSRPGKKRTLADRIDHPATEGGRNQDLASALGFLAKNNRDDHETYLLAAAGYAAEQSPPLDRNEVVKTAESIWKRESTKNRLRVVQPDETTQRLPIPGPETGFLAGSGRNLYTKVQYTEEKVKVEGRAECANFDLTARSLVHGQDEQVNRWEVTVHRVDGTDLDCELPAVTVADSRRFAVWLAQVGGAVYPPDSVTDRGTPFHQRIRMYLESQKPPVVRRFEVLGWHDGVGFVTNDGLVLTTDGPRPDRVVVDAPSPRNWRYGMDPAGIDILAKVLSFHEPWVTAVVGAWLTALVLRPMVRAAAVFPILGVEAPSESGKTTGAIGMLFRLFGLYAAADNPTAAVLRARLNSHNAGMTWVDDPADLLPFMDLMRALATGGGKTKMVKGANDDWTEGADQLSAGLAITAESLGVLVSQKAYEDRIVSIAPPSPTTRMSFNDPGVDQWRGDIQPIRRAYPRSGSDELSRLAGTVVVAVLRNAPDDLDAALSDLRVGAGRSVDKDAWLRLGARVLDGVLGGRAVPGWEGLSVTTLVDAWVTDRTESVAASQVAGENELTKRVLPQALREFDHPTKPRGGTFGYSDCWPVFQSEPGQTLDAQSPEVWFNPAALSGWWRKQHPRDYEERVHGVSALEGQARALGLGGRVGPRSAPDTQRSQIQLQGSGAKRVYWRVNGRLATLILERAGA